MSRTPKKPGYVRHRKSGQARVRINGRDHYLGLIDSPESLQRYAALTEEWSLSKRVDRSTLTIDDLCVRFIAHAKTYYKKGGQETSEVSCIRLALRPLVRLFGNSLACEFGPLKLKEVRQAMVESGIVRTSINRHVDRIRMAFRWATENELQPVEVYSALQTVRGLSKGRTDASEAEPVKPVPIALVEAVRPFVSRQVWGMVETQLLTGARPGEIVSMRVGEINTTGAVWEYVPHSHKTEHKGKTRSVQIGPKAQAALRQFLQSDLSAYVFSPIQASEERSARMRRERKSALTPSQAARKPKTNGQRRPKAQLHGCKLPSCDCPRL